MIIKNDRKKKNPTLVMTVGALAAVGVISIVRGAKKMVKGTADKVKGLLHPPSDIDDI